MVINVENLTKTYRLYNSPLDRLKESLSPLRKKYHRDFHALSSVSFDVRRGEVLGIIGKNGCGKSTLLKIIAGVLTHTSGNVTVKGRISALLELGAGFNSELTGVENIYFNGTLMGYSRDEMDAKLEDILSFADIGDFVRQPVKTYSSGMFVRLAFAVAINIEPEILIIDEALSVGDALFTAKCLSTIDRFRERGTSILLVTHDNSSIKSLCNRAVYLVKGTVSEIGEAGYVADRYIQDLREEGNISFRENTINTFAKRNNYEELDVKQSKDDMHMHAIDDLLKMSSLNRYGSGEVRCVKVELLNLDGQNATHFEFNETIKIRIYLKCYSSVRFSVNYMIRDSKNINLLGSNFRIEGADLIHGNYGDEYVVEYETRVPVSAGDYNVLVEITDPVIYNKSANFIDILENAILFKVVDRKIARLWSKVYIENKLQIKPVR